MSRSVWHKIRESKFVSLEGIQWTEVLQGLQPARKPIPGGMSWIPKSPPVPEITMGKSEMVALIIEPSEPPQENN
jgi:hypothetical protein